MAWHIVALGRAKKIPRLEVMMAKRRASATRQSWQEQQRIMDMWVAVTRRRSQLIKGK